MAEYKAAASDFDPSKITIKPDEEVAKVQVWHPDVEEPESARELDALTSEISSETFDKLVTKVVRLTVTMPGEEVPDEYYMEPNKFQTLFPKGRKAVDVLNEAKFAKGRKRNGGSPENGEVKRYDTLEWAGHTHKGVTTYNEQRFVQNHFPFINKRLLEVNENRLINPDDPKFQKRYDLVDKDGKPKYFTGTFEELYEKNERYREDYDRILGRNQEPADEAKGEASSEEQVEGK